MFGICVAVDEALLIAGAPFDAERGTQAGAAYVFRREGGVWGEEQKLLAEDTGPFQFFGAACDISGNTALVGAEFFGEDNYGAAFIFENQGATWVEMAQLSAFDGDPGDYFGNSVAIEGDVALVASERNNGETGAVYVFERMAGDWEFIEKLTASDQEWGSDFGAAIDIDNGTIVVGAPYDNGVDQDVGAAYVFERVGGAWTQTAKLTASDPFYADHFGGDVSISGDFAVAGASKRLSNEWRGSAYVFQRNNGNWNEVAILEGSDSQPGDVFGEAVAIKGSALLIGAYHVANDPPLDAGKAYLFERIGSSWSECAIFTPSDSKPGTHFGFEVALSEDSVFVSPNRDDDGDVDHVGATYVFLRNEILSGSVNTGDGSPAADVLSLDGSSGDYCGLVEVLAGTPIDLSIATAPSVSPKGHYGVWIFEGGLKVGEATHLLSNQGTLYDLGMGVRCLPINNTESAGSCPCPTSFPIGFTSKKLGNAVATLLCLNRPAYPRSPASFQVTFPEGEFLIGGVVQDNTSILSPAKNLSIANWLHVVSIP